ncbi:Myb-like DNA-binding domain containing protein [Trichomonas vaginalis G3]|uniref:Myb-like DNA-binding domain containing protein n=1 Tax=Trichomonas vaginalis (strain ATCC PRA-98 / G3) TaxID=412133 RepID=A2G127_TRIV3|nr:RNA polymerase II transcription regulator recruiting protein [Trichomonas vaginalis G3]EAX89130.1 Myb-like DNA-binding domain containing protein [Trichomonas vaginalis G3]KAI5495925.1 RNA polymerase II transcription regulator recruiting protein [Trichomonas vaginalis G3]|eukprot:XP_001302060.1 Myb-like DNA-binding domain containing protein [Trichomonas vaginalis G3]
MKWTAEEDEILKSRIEKFGTGNWSLIAQELQGRTGKQCRERWTNQLNPNLNRDNWSSNEDRILLHQQQIFGNSWSKISKYLPGRSSNSIKNRWSWLSRHRALPQKNNAPAIKIQPQIQQQKPLTMNFDPSTSECLGSISFMMLDLPDVEFSSDFNLQDFPAIDTSDKGLSLWDVL